MKAKGYLYVFGMGMQKAMAYRADFFLGLVSCLFPIVMQVFLWNALYAAGAADANGYTYEQVMLYTLLAGVTARIVATGFENEVAADIKTGGLNRYLVKPMDHGRYTLAQFLGGKAAGIALLLAVTAAVLAGAAAVFGLAFAPLRLAVYALSLVLALALNFSIFYTIALLAFWLTEIDQLFGTISIVIMVMSGGVFPLEIFGPAAAALSAVLPFGYTTQFCVNIVSGRLGVFVLPVFVITNFPTLFAAGKLPPALTAWGWPFRCWRSGCSALSGGARCAATQAPAAERAKRLACGMPDVV